MAWTTNVLVGQSGGPTAVINSSLAGVYESAKSLGAPHVYGMQYGIEGLLQGHFVDLDQYFSDKMQIELLKRTPSSFLGSCRFKLPEASVDDRPYRKLFELFEQHAIGAVFYIGGNDSMDTIAKLSGYGASINSPIRFIGVPKTIDNDLALTDHTPGYGSAAKYVATILKEVICDASVYNIRSVTVAEIMGRHTGWLAGAASLAKGTDSDGPDIILLPERRFDEAAFLARVSKLTATRHNVTIAVSEGVKNQDGVFLCDLVSTAGQLDAFGHKAILSGSRTDVTEAYQVGGAAVEAAANGETGRMCAIRRLSNQPYQVTTELVDVNQVANLEKRVPEEWITPDGMQVTEDFERYARPLIQAELTPIYINGVPRHIHLDNV